MSAKHLLRGFDSPTRLKGEVAEQFDNLWHTGLMTERYIRNPNTKCVVCGKPIYKRPIEIKRNSKRVYCSASCYGISCRKEIPCIICGKMILSGLHKKTCSRSCANKHRTGIKYKLNRPKDKVKNYQSLKIRLLQQRGKICERCHYDKYEILQVHHKDKNRLNNNLSNLELICPNCHYEKHFLLTSWLNKKEGGQDGNARVLKTRERKL
ncbi:MAG: HNH endonuclease [Candidatus Roizmanbacteria bacterium GW2011_GWA2_35_8]|uniref:HNH endonuclease n=1 Tax=Candidatus Roizmanbacteria bacterium GW2011_GWA2_35_8 TaxID=1618479 RepID=A0A0G0D1I9_9BACT|nr:MAG: HNH endonuclease [Candidatus Roizmanbacteria bacterium GW2011_GWA2_35_8]